MLLKIDDQAVSFHFFLTPGGWSLSCMAYDKLYEPKDTLEYLELLSKKLKAEGAQMFRPVFNIEYISNRIVSVSWDRDVPVPVDGISQTVRAYVEALDREYNLMLLPVLEEHLCPTNFLPGSSASRFLLKGLDCLMSTQNG